MSSYTTNLNLLKKDPEVDGNDYFNIQTMLNDNWDKLDAGKKMQDDAIVAHEAENATTAAKGHIQLATTAEVATGTDTGKAVTPAGIKVEMDKKINHSLATAVNDFLVASGAGAFVKKTLAEVKAILGLGSAAYTESSAYAAISHTQAFSTITGTVPVVQGGTGQTTLAAARNAMGLGNTTGVLPIANGGTGAATAAAALTALGLTATAAELNVLDGVTGVTAAELSYVGDVTGMIQAQINARAMKYPPTVQFVASKTLALTDAGTFQYAISSSAIVITIPPNSDVEFPTGTEIAFCRASTGAVSFSPAQYVTLNSGGSKRSIKNQYETACLKKIAIDTWVLVGSLSA